MSDGYVFRAEYERLQEAFNRVCKENERLALIKIKAEEMIKEIESCEQSEFLTNEYLVEQLTKIKQLARYTGADDGDYE